MGHDNQTQESLIPVILGSLGCSLSEIEISQKKWRDHHASLFSQLIACIPPSIIQQIQQN